ncbi:hypothetical protein ABEW34_15550 [Paenibacillus algorifonticola]|uniref:hypothetical protein n=1 Tax=Paenibacillus algorifonticola TaxID=684063 RepID=UPI003D2C0C32
MKKQWKIRLWIWFALAIVFLLPLIILMPKQQIFISVIGLFLFFILIVELLILVTIGLMNILGINKKTETKATGFKGQHIHGLPLHKGADIELFFYDQLIFWNSKGFQMNVDFKQIQGTSTITEQEFSKERVKSWVFMFHEKGYLFINYFNESNEYDSIVIFMEQMHDAKSVALQLEQAAGRNKIVVGGNLKRK